MANMSQAVSASPRKRKVQSELEGSILDATEEIERCTGIRVSDQIRQGLVRLHAEFKQEGRVTIWPLPECAPETAGRSA